MREVLRSVWREPRPPVPPRQWWDWVLMAAFALAAALEGALRPELSGRWVVTAVAIGLVPTLLWRRSRPLPMVAVVLGVVTAVTALVTGENSELVSQGYLLVLLYALFRWGSGVAMAVGVGLLLGPIVVTTAVGQVTVSDAVGAAAVLCAAGALGAAFRSRAGVRRRELDQVKLRERERMARDLHDTIGHHVSAIAIRAQAGIATAATDPGAATDALRLIEVEASRALTEMRTIVRILRRDQPATRTPTPGIGDLEQLATSRPGPAVEVTVAGDVDGLPPAVAAAIYRLAQESVTNARRHARHASRVSVQVTAAGDTVTLQVSDDGDTSPAARNRPGYGLTGMAERVGLLGGTWEAGPGPGQGWRVTAVLPRTGEAA